MSKILDYNSKDKLEKHFTSSDIHRVIPTYCDLHLYIPEQVVAIQVYIKL